MKFYIMMFLWAFSVVICVACDIAPTAPVFGFTITYLTKLVVDEIQESF